MLRIPRKKAFLQTGFLIIAVVVAVSISGWNFQGAQHAEKQYAANFNEFVRDLWRTYAMIDYETSFAKFRSYQVPALCVSEENSLESRSCQVHLRRNQRT